MSTRIGLQKMGRKSQPFYRIVVAEKRSKRNGKVIASLGYYDPKTNPPTLKVNQEILNKWISVGAQPTLSVRDLLKL